MRKTYYEKNNRKYKYLVLHMKLIVKWYILFRFPKPFGLETFWEFFLDCVNGTKSL